MSIKHFLFLIGIWLSQKSHAQETGETQSWIGIKPMQYNPSFAGSTGSNRFATTGDFTGASNFSHLNGNAKTMEFSYDNFIPRIGSGIGLILAYTNLDFRFPNPYPNPEGFLKRKSVDASLIFSPKISLKGKYTVAPSVQITYGSMSFASNYVYGYYLSDSSEAQMNYYAIRSGLMFNSKKLYLGYTVSFPIHYIKQPKMNIFSEGKHIIQAGYKFQKTPESKFCFTPQMVFVIPLSWESINSTDYIYINLNFKYKKIIWGLGSPRISIEERTYGNLGIMFGYQTNKIRIMYTQTFGFASFYLGELSIRLLLPNKNKTSYIFQ